MIDLATFISKYLGAANTGENPVNRGQCVGLVEVWLTANGKPHIPGNAVDLLADADPKFYKKVVNIPTNAPPPGAVVCWNGTWGGGYGHTAVVVAANVNALVVFEQNDPTGSPPVVATHNYNGVAGWLTF
jgi:surface antigen